MSRKRNHKPTTVSCEQFQVVIVRKLVAADPMPMGWDELREGYELPPNAHPNCYGGAMLALIKQNLVHRVGVEHTKRPQAHKRLVCQWALSDLPKAHRRLANAGIDVPPSNQMDLFGQGGGGNE